MNLLSLVYNPGVWGPERARGLPRGTQQASTRARFETDSTGHEFFHALGRYFHLGWSAIFVHFLHIYGAGSDYSFCHSIIYLFI